MNTYNKQEVIDKYKSKLRMIGIEPPKFRINPAGDIEQEEPYRIHYDEKTGVYEVYIEAITENAYITGNTFSDLLAREQINSIFGMAGASGDSVTIRIKSLGRNLNYIRIISAVRVTSTIKLEFSIPYNNIESLSSFATSVRTFSSIDIRGINTSKVVTFSNAFKNCFAKEILLSGINTSNLESIEEAFFGCVNLDRLDLIGLDFSKVSLFDNAFTLLRIIPELDKKYRYLLGKSTLKL